MYIMFSALIGCAIDLSGFSAADVTTSGYIRINGKTVGTSFSNGQGFTMATVNMSGDGCQLSQEIYVYTPSYHNTLIDWLNALPNDTVRITSTLSYPVLSARVVQAVA